MISTMPPIPQQLSHKKKHLPAAEYSGRTGVQLMWEILFPIIVIWELFVLSPRTISKQAY